MIYTLFSGQQGGFSCVTCISNYYIRAGVYLYILRVLFVRHKEKNPQVILMYDYSYDMEKSRNLVSVSWKISDASLSGPCQSM